MALSTYLPIWLTSPIWPQSEGDHYPGTYFPYGATIGGRYYRHHGVDYTNPAGTPVLAAAAGTVLVAGHDLGGDLGEREADRLGHERHRPGRSRVDLQHIDRSVPDGVLNIHQPHHPELQGKLPGEVVGKDYEVQDGDVMLFKFNV